MTVQVCLCAWARICACVWARIYVWVCVKFLCLYLYMFNIYRCIGLSMCMCVGVFVWFSVQWHGWACATAITKVVLLYIMLVQYSTVKYNTIYYACVCDKAIFRYSVVSLGTLSKLFCFSGTMCMNLFEDHEGWGTGPGIGDPSVCANSLLSTAGFVVLFQFFSDGARFSDFHSGANLAKAQFIWLICEKFNFGENRDNAGGIRLTKKLRGKQLKRKWLLRIIENVTYLNCCFTVVGSIEYIAIFTCIYRFGDIYL